MFGRGGPFGSMFGNDPFFSDPFATMNVMMGSMLNDPFFTNPFGVVRQPAGYFPAPQPQAPRGQQPVIEEVDDTGNSVRATSAQDDPIVEEPDDEPSPQDRASQRQRRHSPPRQQIPAPHVMPMDPFSQLFGSLASAAAGGGSGSSFMISSSSYSSMGPGGVTYQSSSTTRVGPGGVRETQAVVRDGRSGTESVTISRGLGDGRQRTLVRTRDALTGREQQLEDLAGIDTYEADTFDEQWRTHAERNLPGGGSFGAAVGAARLGSGSAQRRPLALPHAPASAAAPAMAGMYDSNAGLAAAQRATYVRPPSPGGARVRQPSAGAAQYNGGPGAVVGHSGRGAHYGGGGGAAAGTRPRGSVLDGHNYAAGGSQPATAGGGRMPSGSAAGYGMGGRQQSHARHGY